MQVEEMSCVVTGFGEAAYRYPVPATRALFTGFQPGTMPTQERPVQLWAPPAPPPPWQVLHNSSVVIPGK